MFFTHKQIFTISPNNLEAEAFINEYKKRLNVEPTISKTTEGITMIWTERGYIPDNEQTDCAWK